jgi:hypothetical protein
MPVIILIGAAIWVSAAAESLAQDKFHHGQPDEPKLNYDSLWAAATPLEESEGGRRILKDCLIAYGGREHLEELKSLKLTWKMKALSNPDSVDVVKTAAFERKYIVERQRSRGIERRILNGSAAWLQTSDTLVELGSGRYKAELFSYLVMAMPLAAVTEPFSETRYGRRSGDSLDYIYLRKDDSLIVALGLDTANHLVKKAEGVILEGDGRLVFINYFFDHEKHKGYLFPGRMINISMGLRVGESRLHEALINSEEGDSVFLPRPVVGESQLH